MNQMLHKYVQIIFHALLNKGRTADVFGSFKRSTHLVWGVKSCVVLRDLDLLSLSYTMLLPQYHYLSDNELFQ